MVLKNYESLFAQGEDAGPEKIDRRYSWLRRTLREFNNTYKNVFPNEWNLQAMITKEFCDITAGHITDFLEKGMIDTTQLVNILQKTIQFEHEMSKKFSANETMLISGISESGFSNSATYSIDPSADEIRDKYTSQVGSPNMSGDFPSRSDISNVLGFSGETIDMGEGDKNFKQTPPPRIVGSISMCFGPYMPLLMQSEEETLRESVTVSMNEENFEPKDT